MSKIVQRVRRDLHEIADQAPISLSARDSILSRVDEPIDHSEREVVMLDKNTSTPPHAARGASRLRSASPPSPLCPSPAS